MMGLKRTGNVWRAALYAVGALAMLVGTVLVVVNFIMQLSEYGVLTYAAWLASGQDISGESESLLNLALFLIAGLIWLAFMLALDTMMGIAAIRKIAHQRGLRAAAEHDNRGAPPATFQPDTALALASGEILTLTRTRHTNTARRLFFVLFVLLVFTGMGELVIFMLFPAVSPFNRMTPLTAFGVQSAPPFSLDWVSLGYPLAWGLCYLLAVFFTGPWGRRQQIIADDRGITLAISGRRRRFIPWNDIIVFALPEKSKRNSLAGDYVVWGREHGLNFEIGGRVPQAKSATIAGTTQTQVDSYDYADGYEVYETNARRLLATIAARSYVPLRTFAGFTTLLNIIKDPVCLDDVLAAPEADPRWQPQPETIAAMSQPGASVTLRARIAALAALGESVILGVALGAAVPAITAIQAAGGPNTDLPWQGLQSFSPVVAAAIISSYGLCMVGMGATVVFRWWRDRRPAITADMAGLRAKMLRGGSMRVVAIPWEDMRAWGVLPATPGSRRPTTYFAFSDDQKAIWKEPAGARLAGRGVHGDRRAAYQARSEELHALIVARTGLPLKLLATGTMPEMVGMETQAGSRL